jgi:hypothetical protein
MAVPHYAHADVFPDYVYNWMIYYTQHKKMVAPHYVYADVFPDHSYNWRIYYTHHRNMDFCHHVWVPRSEYSGGRKKQSNIVSNLVLIENASLKSRCNSSKI